MISRDEKYKALNDVRRKVKIKTGTKKEVEQNMLNLFKNPLGKII